MKARCAILVALCGALTAWALTSRPVGDNSITTNKRTLSSQPCIVTEITGQSTNTVGQFIHIYEFASRATNGGTPTFAFPIAGNQYFSFDFPSDGISLASLTVCNSTTAQTTTLGATNCSFQAAISAP